MTTLPAFRGLVALPDADKLALVGAAEAIGLDPDWLATIIQFESGGSFSPSKKNAAGSGATGLIQFMPATAEGLGTTTDALAAMSFAEQLEYVKRYFQPWASRIKSLDDAYLAVLYPAFIGRADDAVLGASGSTIYEQNKGFDRDGKGYITKADITQTIRNVAASAPGRVEVPGTPPDTGGGGDGTGGGSGAGGAGIAMRVAGEVLAATLLAAAIGYAAWTYSPASAPWKGKALAFARRVTA